MKKAVGNDKLAVKIQKIKDKKVASILTISEESRRMQDMMKMYGMSGMGMGDMGKEGETLVLNYGHPLVKSLIENKDKADNELICEQLYDLARLMHAPLEAEEMSRFIERSNELMGKLVEK